MTRLYFNERYIPHTPGAYVRLTVADAGTGAEEATRQHMFEPFCADKDICPGIGSGLGMIYDIVKQSSSYIFVDSKVRKETAFRTYLPQVEKEVGLSEKDKLFKQIPKGKET